MSFLPHPPSVPPDPSHQLPHVLVTSPPSHSSFISASHFHQHFKQLPFAMQLSCMKQPPESIAPADILRALLSLPLQTQALLLKHLPLTSQKSLIRSLTAREKQRLLASMAGENVLYDEDTQDEFSVIPLEYIERAAKIAREEGTEPMPKSISAGGKFIAHSGASTEMPNPTSSGDSSIAVSTTHTRTGSTSSVPGMPSTRLRLASSRVPATSFLDTIQRMMLSFGDIHFVDPPPGTALIIVAGRIQTATMLVWPSVYTAMHIQGIIHEFITSILARLPRNTALKTLAHLFPAQSAVFLRWRSMSAKSKQDSVSHLKNSATIGEDTEDDTARKMMRAAGMEEIDIREGSDSDMDQDGRDYAQERARWRKTSEAIRRSKTQQRAAEAAAAASSATTSSGITESRSKKPKKSSTAAASSTKASKPPRKKSKKGDDTTATTDPDDSITASMAMDIDTLAASARSGMVSPAATASTSKRRAKGASAIGVGEKRKRGRPPSGTNDTEMKEADNSAIDGNAAVSSEDDEESGEDESENDLSSDEEEEEEEDPEIRMARDEKETIAAFEGRQDQLDEELREMEDTILAADSLHQPQQQQQQQPSESKEQPTTSAATSSSDSSAAPLRVDESPLSRVSYSFEFPELSLHLGPLHRLALQDALASHLSETHFDLYVRCRESSFVSRSKKKAFMEWCLIPHWLNSHAVMLLGYLAWDRIGMIIECCTRLRDQSRYARSQEPFTVYEVNRAVRHLETNPQTSTQHLKQVIPFQPLNSPSSTLPPPAAASNVAPPADDLDTTDSAALANSQLLQLGVVLSSADAIAAAARTATASASSVCVTPTPSISSLTGINAPPSSTTSLLPLSSSTPVTLPSPTATGDSIVTVSLTTAMNATSYKPSKFSTSARIRLQMMSERCQWKFRQKNEEIEAIHREEGLEYHQIRSWMANHKPDDKKKSKAKGRKAAATSQSESAQ